MPTIACPGCGKQYNVPATAAGQVAKCACGKRFRLASAQKSNAAAPAAEVPRAPVAAAKAASSEKSTRTTADDFWDEALADPPSTKAVATAKPKAPASEPRPVSPISAAGRAPAAPEKPKAKKKKKKSGGIRWGFDWAKVGGGLTTMVVAGGITLVLLESTGRLYFWPAGVAIVGLFTCLSGLMGEEGIW